MLYRSVCKTCDAVIKAGQPVESEMRLNGDYGKPCVCCGIKKPLREGYRRIRNPERLAKPEYVFHNTCKVCEARKPTPSQACAKCGVDKPLTAYSTDLNRGNGRCVTCRECCAGDKYGVSKHTDYKTDYRPWEIFYYPAARANV
jgi:ribosomal protein L40E